MSDEPSETPRCAGRRAVAHERTPMRRSEVGWICPTCWEIAPDDPVEVVVPLAGGRYEPRTAQEAHEDAVLAETVGPSPSTDPPRSREA